MIIEEAANRIIWRTESDVELGTLVLDDKWKPYLHPVRTLKGNSVTVAKPVDHRHHKGVMYALRCEDLNFWEEEAETHQAGVQKIDSYETNGASIILKLTWAHANGERETYRETRTITFSELSGSAYNIIWRTQRESLRDHTLIQSQWSMDIEDGRKINYHGLGIRLPWAWTLYGLPQWGNVEVDGRTISDAKDACGSSEGSVRWTGGFDGQWWHEAGAVTLSQKHGFPFYSVRSSIPYLSTGPTVEKPLEVKCGDTFDETYSILIEDIESLDVQFTTG